MRICRMKIVARPIEVRGHHAPVVRAKLPVVTLAELYSRNLCDGVGLIRRLQRARQQGALGDRLWRQARIDT